MIARRFIAAACTLFLTATVAVTIARENPQQARRGGGADAFAAYLPPGDGQALVAKGCIGCHDLGGVVRLRAAAPKWEALVLDMGARGAPIELDDIDPMVRYLSHRLRTEGSSFRRCALRDQGRVGQAAGSVARGGRPSDSGALLGIAVVSRAGTDGTRTRRNRLSEDQVLRLCEVVTARPESIAGGQGFERIRRIV